MANLTEEEQDLIMRALNNYKQDREEEELAERIFIKLRAEARKERTKIEFEDPTTAVDARNILSAIFEGEVVWGGDSLYFEDRITAREAAKILRRDGMTIPDQAIQRVA